MTVPQVPVRCHVLCATREEALAVPRGDITLSYCQSCGHVFNPAFEPELMAYTQSYDNSLHFSPRFREYAEATAAHLVERYNIRGKQIVEIGSGKGEFLRLICALGRNHGYGFDPSYVPDGADAHGEITFVQDFYSERYSHYQADLICCRHVLEHIEEPRGFVSMVRRAIGEGRETAVFFEVPNVGFTLHDMGIWDLIYEHCSYFSHLSLAHLFASCGFAIADLREEFGGQYLAIEALPAAIEGAAPAPAGELFRLAQDVGAFARNYRERVSRWRQQLAELAHTGRRVVAWGAGSKGVTFLNLVASLEAIPAIVDLNPRKHGKYVAGSGQRIIAVEALRDERPDVVVVMNPLYQSEIRRATEAIGLECELLCV